MKRPKLLRMGATKSLTRPEAIREYVILRLRFDEIEHLDYLLNGLRYDRITLPDDSPFSPRDLANTVRTCFMGWFSSLTDKDPRATYAFNCLLNLFPNHRAEIITVQQSLEACHEELQQFRNNVAFHVRSDIAAHIRARAELQDSDTYLDLVSAIQDFKRLMEKLISEESNAIPELPRTLEQMRVQHMPAFSRRKRPNPT